MAAYVIAFAAAEIYSAAYAVYSFRKGPVSAAIAAMLMAVLPLALFIISLI